jgi:hypothetical protein
MSEADFDRVRADLAIIKQACTEPAIPSEEIGAGLVVAVLGTILAIAPWVVPPLWVKVGGLVCVTVCLAIYVPWKRRIMKRDAPRRALEAKEILIWTVASIGLVAYMIVSALAFPRSRGYADACFFAVGLGCLANGLVHPTRRHAIAIGLCVMIGAVLLPFATGFAASTSIGGVCTALVGLSSAATLAWLTRRERRKRVPD